MPPRQRVFRDASNTPSGRASLAEAHHHLARKGELKVLGVRVSATSVRKVLLEAGSQAGATTNALVVASLLRAQAASTLACHSLPSRPSSYGVSTPPTS